MSHQLIGYWSNPNADGAPRWPRYQPTTMPSFTAAGTQLIDFATEHHCPFWQTVRR